MKRWWLLLLWLLFLTGCEYKEIEREIGYKGKARVNPWLAVERFAASNGRKVKSVISWTAPEWGDAVWLVPASILSNESYTRKMENWVDDGGHLIVVVEHAASETNDWFGHPTPPDLRPALFHMLERAGIELQKSGSATAESVSFDGEDFEVKAESTTTVSSVMAESSVTGASGGGESGVFVSRELGSGRITVITDGRILRNRWISDCEHADLLMALMDSTGYDGALGIMRGSGLSLAALIREYLGEFLLGLVVWLGLWLWKGVSRFGPVEPASQSAPLLGYDHHLEALGDFQWRQDKGASLLAPLREQIIELGQRASVGAGRRDDDFFQYLADRAELPRERVFRALAEQTPADSNILTRTAADLQLLLKVLNPNSKL